MRDVAGTTYVVYNNSWPGLLAMTMLGAVPAALFVIGPHGTFLLHAKYMVYKSLNSLQFHGRSIVQGITAPDTTGGDWFRLPGEWA